MSANQSLEAVLSYGHFRTLLSSIDITDSYKRESVTYVWPLKNTNVYPQLNGHPWRMDSDLFKGVGLLIEVKTIQKSTDQNSD